MEDVNWITAGYCGLACKSCSVYIASCVGGKVLEDRANKAGMEAEELRCEGCRSVKTSPYCNECSIKKCIRQKNLKWCSACESYPCELLLQFQKSLPHRKEIFASLNFAKEHSLEEWEQEMQRSFACENCGTYNTVYASNCLGCGSQKVNSFAQRHYDIIKDSPERKLV